MTDERKEWERLPGEPNLWYSRFETFRLMGPKRSLFALYQDIRAQAGASRRSQIGVPQSWRRASNRWRWRDRAEAWDEAERQRVRAEYEAQRRAILEEGFALDHERVKALKELANILLDELRQYERRWVQDVKQVGSGENAERVNIERFNAAEVEQLRGLLDDIAKEKGERRQTQRHELTGADGGPIQQRVTLDLSTASDQELDELERCAVQCGGNPG